MNLFQQIFLCCACLLFASKSFAQQYRVQIAAYVEKVPFSYFSDSDIFGVFMLTDQNNIYRYYIGEYVDKEEAERAKNVAIKKGFKHASIIDVEEQRKLCGTPCPYISYSSTYSDESTEPLNLTNIFFGFDQAKLTVEAKEELDRVAKILKNNSKLKVLVSGHTDSKGPAAYNISLSKRRARNARSYLINKGIKSKRIIAQVFGESNPSEDNLTAKGDDSAEGRKFNRRVVLAIYDTRSNQIILDQN